MLAAATTIHAASNGGVCGDKMQESDQSLRVSRRTHIFGSLLCVVTASCPSSSAQIVRVSRWRDSDGASDGWPNVFGKKSPSTAEQ